MATIPHLSRRRFLQAGVLPALGLNLPKLLAAPASGRATSCIFIYQYGGLSQIDSWDPKPDGPSETRGPYKPIATSVPGFQVGELMPELARVADRYAVIRSMSHPVPVHDLANTMLLTGRSRPASGDPSLGAIVTKLRPSDGPVPSHVWLQKFGGGAMPPDASYTTGGLLGMAHAPMVISHGHEDNFANPSFRVDAFDGGEGLTPGRVRDRMDLLDRIDASPKHDRFRERAFDLLAGPSARRAFDLEAEPDAVRDRYGRNPLGQNLLMARRLVEAGVRLVNVVAWCGLKAGEKFVSVETWDMHGNAGVDIFGDGWNGLGYALPICDRAVATLIADLDDRGLLDSTLVVLVGEFGRTPRISRGGSAIGRDHWSQCYSAMLAGGGVRGGAVHGASDRTGAYVRNRPVSPEDFAATVLHALGIAPSTPVHPDGFSLRAAGGEPIAELF